MASQGGQEGDRSTVAPGADGPSVAAAQMPTATIIGRTASDEPGRHDCASGPGIHVAVAMATVHSAVTRRELSCAG